jgi:hypothetical protein
MNCEYRIVLRGSDNGFLSTGLLTTSTCEQIANKSNHAVIAAESRAAAKNYSQEKWPRISCGEQVLTQTRKEFPAFARKTSRSRSPHESLPVEITFGNPLTRCYECPP